MRGNATARFREGMSIYLQNFSPRKWFRLNLTPFDNTASKAEQIFGSGVLRKYPTLKGLVTMANYSNQKPDPHKTQSSDSSGTTIAIIIAAIVLVVGAFLLFTANDATVSPQVSHNTTTLPAPGNEIPAAPPTPPVSQSTTPSAETPAANP